MRDKISVIIPAHNEDKNIGNAIRSAAKGKSVDIIVVDGGSGDKTVEIAEAEGATVFQSALGRAGQMNYGADKAAGQILIFLHSDTILPENFDSEVRRLLGQKHVAAGAFLLKTDYESRMMKALEILVALRSRLLGLPYGDQAIFIKKEVFKKTGGFPNIPIMEDFAYIKKLGKLGKISMSDLSVVTSGRRWREFGVLRNTLVNQAIIIGYLAGVSPFKLKNLRRKSN